MKTRKLITVVIPAYNEEASLPLCVAKLDEVFAELPDYIGEYLFVDDGSSDRTLDILRELSIANSRVRYLSFSRNFGKESAVLAGCDASCGDATVIMDADLQHPPSMIPEMIHYYEQGYDDVYAKRTDRKAEGLLKKNAALLFYRLLKSLSNDPMQQNVGDFRLLSRRAVEAFCRYREFNRYNKGYYALIGFAKKELVFTPDPRVAGTTKWNHRQLFRLALNGLFAFSIAPLRLSSILGAVVAAGGFIYALIVALEKIFYGNPVPGFASLLVAVSIFSGLQLCAIGILGEYIGRIYQESRHRPLYIVKDQSVPVKPTMSKDSSQNE